MEDLFHHLFHFHQNLRWYAGSLTFSGSSTIAIWPALHIGWYQMVWPERLVAHLGSIVWHMYSCLTSLSATHLGFKFGQKLDSNTFTFEKNITGYFWAACCRISRASAVLAYQWRSANEKDNILMIVMPRMTSDRFIIGHLTNSNSSYNYRVIFLTGFHTFPF